jgi:hypothetical protein
MLNASFLVSQSEDVKAGPRDSSVNIQKNIHIYVPQELIL